MEIIWNFIVENWVNLLLVVVTSFVLVVYLLQERKKVTEAASLIKIQIDELQKGILEIDSFIVNDQLNATAFYESQLLLDENYWNKYKHYFVRKMDSKDFESISKMYEYASEIQEQQILMKNLQKSFFGVSQQTIAMLEMNEIMKQLNSNNSQSIENIKSKLLLEITDNKYKEIAQKIITTFENEKNNQAIISYDYMLQNKQKIIQLINSNYLTQYCPLQIKITLEKYIKKYSLLEIDGTDGYKMLKKTSKRRF